MSERAQSTRGITSTDRMQLVGAWTRLARGDVILLPMLVCMTSIAACGRPAAVASVATACDHIVWAPAETLRAPGGNPIYVDGGQAFPHGNATLLIGSWAIEWDSTGRIIPHFGGPDSLAGAGYLVRPDGSTHRIPLPVPLESYHAPRVVASAANIASVIWSTADTAHQGVEDLYAADLVDAQWSTVTRIPTGRKLRWSVVNQSSLLSVGGELRLSSGTVLLETASPVLVRRNEAGWTATPLKMEHHVYSRLAALPGDTLVMAYVAPTVAQPNVLFAQRFTTAGDSVGPRVTISTPGAGRAFEHQLVAGGDSILYLVWSLGASPGTISELGFAVSRDRGLTWQKREGAKVHGGFDVLRASLDPLGRLHLALRGDHEGLPHVRHLYWTADGWQFSFVPPVKDGLGIGLPSLLLDDLSTPRLFWAVLTMRDGQPAGTFAAVSRGRRTCRGTNRG